jgi:hypothetical protein
MEKIRSKGIILEPRMSVLPEITVMPVEVLIVNWTGKDFGYDSEQGVILHKTDKHV